MSEARREEEGAGFKKKWKVREEMGKEKRNVKMESRRRQMTCELQVHAGVCALSRLPEGSSSFKIKAQNLLIQLEDGGEDFKTPPVKNRAENSTF